MDTNKLILSVPGKIKYLNRLVGKTLKILHLLEEESQTGYNPKDYIYGQLIELNSANQLFEGELAVVVIKYNVIYNLVDKRDEKGIRKQVFEIKQEIEYLQKKYAQ